MIRREPCSSCPYRRDVPSGVWAWTEYEKLRDYDLPTGEQPWAVFACHATPEHLCHGWAVVHQNRGNPDGIPFAEHPYDLIALRIWFGDHPGEMLPPAAVPLFGSGNEAADHGQRDIEDPPDEAIDTVARLVRKYPRLRGEE